MEETKRKNQMHEEEGALPPLLGTFTNRKGDLGSEQGMGSGHAIVEELVGFGARVHTCCRNENELDGCLSEWDNLGFGVTGSVCDVSV
ncbi:tropinone reductase like protein [Quercus suber]|uniref:Tropinone reductase like protein n=1 Tax=Quercus suber TaxID=58331 RepID=A0AAW0LZM7_QUESU